MACIEGRDLEPANVVPHFERDSFLKNETAFLWKVHGPILHCSVLDAFRAYVDRKPGLPCKDPCSPVVVRMEVGEQKRLHCGYVKACVPSPHGELSIRKACIYKQGLSTIREHIGVSAAAAAKNTEYDQGRHLFRRKNPWSRNSKDSNLAAKGHDPLTDRI